MKVIYYDYGGAHSSVLAASLHTGTISGRRRPTSDQIRHLPHFDQATPADHGRLVYIGDARPGVEVYVLGCRRYHTIARRALRGVARAYGIPHGDLVMADTLPGVNLAMRVGGLLSRGLGLSTIGRPLVAWGTRSAFFNIMRIVDRTRDEVDRRLAGREGAGPPQATRPGPKVFYHCYGSSHSSVVASAIHTEKLSIQRKPTPDELVALPHFDRVGPKLIGTVFYIGDDRDGREVYIVGLATGKHILVRAINDLVKSYGFPDGSLTLVNSLTAANWLAKLGGLLSRGLGLRHLGRPLAVAGVLQRYYSFIRLVEGVVPRLSLDGRESLPDNEE